MKELQADCVKGRYGFQNSVRGLVVINVEGNRPGYVQTENTHHGFSTHGRTTGNQVEPAMKCIHDRNKAHNLLHGINTDRVSNHSFVLQKTSLISADPPGIRLY